MSLRAQDVYAILNSKIKKGLSTGNYDQLSNKPQINDIELVGNKSLDELGIQPAGDYLTDETLPDNFVEF